MNPRVRSQITSGSWIAFTQPRGFERGGVVRFPVVLSCIQYQGAHTLTIAYSYSKADSLLVVDGAIE